MRKIIITAIICVVVLTGAAALMLMTRGRATNSNANQPVTNTTGTSTTTNSTNTPAVNAVVAPPTADQSSATLVARNFAERYGSYASSRPGENFRQAASLATPSWAAVLAANAAKTKTSVDTHIMVTQAYVVTIKQQTAARMVISVDTRRQETIGQVTKTIRQTLLLEVLKDNQAWKVNNAVWQTAA